MFTDCKTSDETSNLISKIISEAQLKDIKEYMSCKFYNSDEVTTFLYYTLLSKRNVVLYGPGGFGKSQMVKVFLDYFDIPQIVKVGNSDTDVESLLGIPNIKKLINESEYETGFEKSIFNKAGALILEEFMDVRPSVAAALKDIITEKGLREGDKFFNSLIGPIIICSNKSPNEASTDLSTSAFYKERFPYSLYVVWDSYTADDYYNMFKILYDIEDSVEDNFKITARLCAESYHEEEAVSPRIAIDAINIFLKSNSLDSFQYISQIDTSKIDLVIEEIKINKMYKLFGEDLIEYARYIQNQEFVNLKSTNAFISLTLKFKEFLQSSEFKGDNLLSIISNTIKVIDIKIKEAESIRLKFGEEDSNFVKELKVKYEDIQKRIL